MDVTQDWDKTCPAHFSFDCTNWLSVYIQGGRGSSASFFLKKESDKWDWMFHKTQTKGKEKLGSFCKRW